MAWRNCGHGLLAVLAVLVFAAFPAGCGGGSTASPVSAVSTSEPSASSTDARTDASYRMMASWDPDILTIANQTGLADVVVVGEVVKVDPARWNSPDGNEWKPSQETSIALVYTTFYVAPSEMLKGSPKWGPPVPFRILGGVVDSKSGTVYWSTTGEPTELKPGDQVVVFGIDEQRYGKEGTYVSPGYWLTSDANSLWIKTGSVFANQGKTKSADEQSIALATLVNRVQVAAAPH